MNLKGVWGFICDRTGTWFDSVDCGWVWNIPDIPKFSVKVRLWPLNLNDSWADVGSCPNKKLTVNFSTVDTLRLKQQSVVYETGWVRLPQRKSEGKRVELH